MVGRREVGGSTQERPLLARHILRVRVRAEYHWAVAASELSKFVSRWALSGVLCSVSPPVHVHALFSLLLSPVIYWCF